MNRAIIILACLVLMLALASCAHHQPKSAAVIVEDTRTLEEVMDHLTNTKCSTKEEYFAMLDKDMPQFCREWDKALTRYEKSPNLFNSLYLFVIFQRGEVMRPSLAAQEEALLAKYGPYTKAEEKKIASYFKAAVTVIDKHKKFFGEASLQLQKF